MITYDFSKGIPESLTEIPHPGPGESGETGVCINGVICRTIIISDDGNETTISVPFGSSFCIKGDKVLLDGKKVDGVRAVNYTTP